MIQIKYEKLIERRWYIVWTGTKIRMKGDFLLETRQDRNPRAAYIKDMKEKYCQPRILYFSKMLLLFIFDTQRWNKEFNDVQQLKESFSSRQVMQEKLKEGLQAEENEIRNLDYETEWRAVQMVNI